MDKTQTRIKELRLARGMTLEEVGNLVGVGKSTVRKWEQGIIANMKRDKIAKLARALGVTPSYLMGWDDEDHEEATAAGATLGKAARDPQQVELLRVYQSLSDDNKAKLLQFADALSLLP